MQELCDPLSILLAPWLFAEASTEQLRCCVPTFPIHTKATMCQHQLKETWAKHPPLHPLGWSSGQANSGPWVSTDLPPPHCGAAEEETCSVPLSLSHGLSPALIASLMLGTVSGSVWEGRASREFSGDQGGQDLSDPV